MSANPKLLIGVVFLLVGVAWGRLAAAPAERVGVYDSRAVAYAHFWSPGAEREREEAMAAARAAQAAGDTAEFKRRSAAMADLQKRMHAEVFGAAPATEALAALTPRLPEVLRELGVARLVARWDTKALRDVPETARVDVTDALVRQFITPNDRQRKVLESMKTTAPVSHWRIRLLNFLGAA